MISNGFLFLGSFFISDQNVNAKSNRNRYCIFVPLEIPRVARWIISFMLHTSFITSLQTDTYIDKLLEIFLKLSMKTVQVLLIIGTTLVMSISLGKLFGKVKFCISPVIIVLL